MYNLRDYQAQFTNDIRQAFACGYNAPVGVLPTGGGKTVIMSNITESATLRGNKTAILSHRQELVIQTSLALAEAGVYHSICASTNVVQQAIRAHIDRFGRSFYEYQSRALVASVQTLVRRLHDHPNFDFIIIDECHHAVAGTWRKIIDTYPKAKLLGLTATPLRLDGRGLGDIFDKIVMGATVGGLIGRGFLSRYKVYAPPSQLDLEGIKIIAGDYHKGELARRVNKATITGDVISHYKRICDRIPAIVFCVSVEHAQNVAEEFRQAGYRAASIDGKTDDYTRRAVINSLTNGNLDQLVSCELVSEGTDIPVAGAAIMLRPSQSLGLVLQQMGRVLRPYPGKEYSYILDHVGNVARHGFPDDERIWSLAGRSKRGSKGGSLYTGPAVRQCMKCYAMFPTSVDVCPQCGVAVQKSRQEIEQIEGELIEIQKAKERQMLNREQAEAKSYQDLLELAKRRGYSAGWARHVYNSRHKAA